MKTTTSAKTIERLKTLFSSFGLPGETFTDNADCFSQGNGVKSTHKPPYRSESNGAAERCVQIVKNNLIRQTLEKHLTSQNLTLQHKLDNFLFAYRNTPTSVTGMTPAEMFLSWKPRTKLAMSNPKLHKTIEHKRRQQEEVSDRQRGQSRLARYGQEMINCLPLKQLAMTPLQKNMKLISYVLHKR